MTSAASQITILIPDPDEMMFVAGDNEANIDRIVCGERVGTVVAT